MFTSYAQNLEDVVLWRALGKVANGFYIDVGANHPSEDSVTLGFYEQGWHGINVEPVPAHIEELRRERPRDANLQVAVGSKAGVLEFFETDRRGLSTLLPEIAEAHRRSGLAVKSYQVPVVTLAQVCEQHAPADIHFLKIDVEGAEREVLEGADFRRFRPWIVVIESTFPNSREPRHEQWEHLLLDAGYAFAYFDGVNRFYALADRPDLLDALRLPPNVHDAYTFRLHEGHYFSYPLDRHLQRIEELGGELRRLDEDLERQAATAARYLKRLREREDELQRVYASRSWKMTAPLRAAVARMRGQPEPKAPRAGNAEARALIPAGRRIFIECTHTYHSDLNTGIQRVVRNVLRNALVLGPELGFEVVPVICEGGKFVHADTQRVLADKQRAQPPRPAPVAPAPDVSAAARVRMAFRLPYRFMLRMIDKALPHPAVRQFLYAEPHRFGLAWTVRLPWRAVKKVLRIPEPPAPVPAPAPISLDDYSSHENSILLLLDSSWTIPLWDPVHRFRERGGFVAGVIYDLIPITHPHTSVETLTRAFDAWLSEHLSVTRAFVAISGAVAGQLRAFIAEYSRREHVPVAVDVSHFHLGSELDFVDPDVQPREAVRAVFERPQHVFLMVGSIEPRKNHAYVLDAFEQFWAAGGDAVLAIVGKQGWKTEAFLERVAQHPQLGRRLFLMRDVNDEELDFGYRNASALVIASEVEGFGLPVVEAFQRGLPVLCSDIPVFREIAEGRGDFFDLGNPQSLAGALASFCAHHPVEDRRRRVVQPWITWRESTQQLLAAVLRAFEAETAGRRAGEGARSSPQETSVAVTSA